MGKRRIAQPFYKKKIYCFSQKNQSNLNFVFEIQGPPTHTVIFHLAMRDLKCCDRISFMGFHWPQHVDILLFEADFLIIQPIWCQFLQLPEINNFTLVSDLCNLMLPKLNNQFFAIVFNPYHQIESKFVTNLSINPIF